MASGRIHDMSWHVVIISPPFRAGVWWPLSLWVQVATAGWVKTLPCDVQFPCVRPFVLRRFPPFWYPQKRKVCLKNGNCRASHTGDAGRGRGRERERGMSSELANMTCWGSAAYLGAMLAHLGLCWPILRLCWPMPNVVIYSILCCEMVRTRVNTTVLVPESG